MRTNVRKVELPELVNELQKQDMMKKDFVVPSSCIIMENGNLIVLNNDGSETLQKILNEINISSSDELISHTELTPIGVFHSQVAEKLGIPKRYYDKMNTDSHIKILDNNVTYWLKESKSNFMLRTFLDKDEKFGVVRALLSDRFRVIDNYDILLAVLSAIRETGLNIKIDENGCDITDKRMYVRFICPDVEIQAPELLKNYKKPDGSNNVGTGIVSGFVITNSEVGFGTMSISPRAKVLVCNNGLVVTKEKFSQVHLGAKLEQYSTVEWSEGTKQKNLELIISQIKDYVIRFSSAEFLGESISSLIEKNKELEYPTDAVVNICNKLSITEEKQKDILNFFIKSGDMSSFGLSQSLTYFAHAKANADEQYEIETSSIEVVNNIKEYDKPIPKKTTKLQSALN